MAKTATTRKPARAKAAPSAPAATTIVDGAPAASMAPAPPAAVATPTAPASAAPPAAADVIRMLVGQEGPAVSRARGQELTIGDEIDADEAQRLVDAEFAERV